MQDNNKKAAAHGAQRLVDWLSVPPGVCRSARQTYLAPARIQVARVLASASLKEAWAGMGTGRHLPEAPALMLFAKFSGLQCLSNISLFIRYQREAEVAVPHSLAAR